MLLTLSEIVDAAHGTLIKGSRNYLIENISIDTRTLKQHDLFIAIKGKSLNGHRFINEAFNKGACCVIKDKDYLLPLYDYPGNFIEVKDTTKALGDIALYFRKKFTPDVIAITGSNGKTTTKEMIAKILESRLSVIKSPNSYNNDIGVPLTVLQLNPQTQALIIEMEMNELGGTRRLCEIAQPHIGIITNIGDTHLEFMKSREGVAQEKEELLEAVAKFGIAIVNADDPFVMEIGNKYNYKEKILFGFDKKADVHADNIVNKGEDGSEFRLNNKYQIKLPIPGVYNIYNALAAISAAKALDFDFADVVSILAQFQPIAMRMERFNINGMEIINDAYNANPQSMMAAIETFVNFTGKGRKVLILGDMLELGKNSPELHRNVGKNIPDRITVLVTVGEQAQYIAEGAKETNKVNLIVSYSNSQEAANKLVDILRIGDRILFKGSRLVKMEIILNKLKEYYESKTS